MQRIVNDCVDAFAGARQRCRSTVMAAWVLCVGFLAMLPVGNAASGEVTALAADFFEMRIRPALAQSCFQCHGPTKQSNNLRLDSRQGMLTGGDSGPAIIVGKPEASLLIQSVRQTHPDFKMPPKGKGEKLPAAVIADLAAWIRAGAPWPAEQATTAPSSTAQSSSAIAARAAALWSFQPIAVVRPPEGSPADQGRFQRTEIDRLVSARWSALGLLPAPEADKGTLLRRLSFDLIGLPPTPQELSAFIADNAANAYEKAVDRLLASPAYGERWGRLWLDLARYADTAGNSSDHPIPQAALYRDWVIGAFNSDKPYHQFITEQLAGDILAEKPGITDEQFRSLNAATGFISLSRRYGVGRMQDMHLTIEDTIDTMGRSMMGLTLKCARCHHHKFDPITTNDYYALYGMFVSTQYPFSGSENSKQPSRLTPAIRGNELAAYLKSINDYEARLMSKANRSASVAELVKIRDDLETLSEKHVLNNEELKRLDKLEKDQARLQPIVDKLTGISLPADPPYIFSVTEGSATHARIMNRGEPRQLGAVVKRGVPALITGPPKITIPDRASGRLQLAQWLTDPKHPLTARVAVNWLWQHHFGVGIVATHGNFGMRGDAPRNPELLDWLATTLIADGWSLKSMHKRMVMSAVYRQSSAISASAREKDPDNHWLARASIRRMDAEQQRDALLMASGELTMRDKPGDLAATVFHPFPPRQQWNYTQHRQFFQNYDHTARSVYLCVQRISAHPYLALFDGADPNAITEVRRDTTVPLQALWSLNSEFIRARAKAFGKRLAAQGTSAGIRSGFLLTAGREPSAGEAASCASFLAVPLAPTSDDPQPQWTALARVLMASNATVFIY